MATKKKTAEQAPDSQTVTAAPEQAVTEAEPREEGGAHVEETTSEVRETSVDPQEDVAAVVRAEAGPQLESLSVLADRHRVPTWMDAALRRMMGWEAGKMVTDAAYREALNGIRTRRMCGGRVR